MKNNALVALLVLVTTALVVTWTVGSTSVRRVNTTVDAETVLNTRLDVLGGEYGPYGKKIVNRGAGVMLKFDDGDTSFLTQVVHVADSLYATWADRYGNDLPPRRIRATTSVVATAVDAGTAHNMTWEQLRTLNGRQDVYEIAGHGLASVGGMQVLGPNEVGMTWDVLDSVLGWTVDRMTANGIMAPRTFRGPGGEQRSGIASLWMKHGYSGFLASGIHPLLINTGNTNDGVNVMDCNMDQLAWASVANGASADPENGFQGYGRITDRFNVGMPRGWRNSSGDDLDRLTTQIDAAVQSGSMALLNFHLISTDTTHIDPVFNLALHPNILRGLFEHIDSLLAYVPHFESLTAEQAIARGTGRVVGQLLPHNNFFKLSWIGSTWPTAQDTCVPLCWPYAGNQYITGASDWGAEVAGDTAAWKAFKLADDDTIAGEFAAVGWTDSLTYGSARDTLGVAVAQWLNNAATARTNEFPIPPTPVTGVESDYVNVYVEAICSDSTVSTEFYVGCTIYQWEEMAEDYVSDAQTDYNYNIMQGMFNLPGRDSTEATRIRGLNLVAQLDTIRINQMVQNTPNEWSAGSSEKEQWRFSPGEIRPYILNDLMPASGMESQFGDYSDMTSKAHFDDARKLDAALKYRTWTFKVRLHERADVIAGGFWFRIDGGGVMTERFADGPTMFVTNVSIEAGI